MAALAVAVVAVATIGAVALTGRQAPSGPPELEVASLRFAAAAQRSAGYLEITNAGGGDELIGVTSTIAGRITLHGLDMQPVDSIEIPAGGRLLAPGRGHLMLEDLHRPLPPGTQVPVRLELRLSGVIDTTAEVLTYADLAELLLPR